MSHGHFSSGSSGYETSPNADGPPRFVLSDATLRTALSQAASSGRLSQNDSDAIRRSNHDAIRPSSGRRHHSEKSSRGCDCCRPGYSSHASYDTPPSSSHGNIGSMRTDANGDRVQEWDGDGQPDLRIHCPPSPPPEAEQSYRRKPSSAGRKHSSSSISSGSSAGSGPARRGSYVTQNADGDRVEEWGGEGELGLRIHRPATPPESGRSERRSSKSSHSSGSSSGRPSKDRKKSSSSSGRMQLGM